MSNFQQYFENRVNEILQSAKGKTVIFFKGFSFVQNEFLIHHESHILKDIPVLSDGFLEVEKIKKSWIKILSEIEDACDPKIGIYEELIAIQRELDNIDVEEILVIENNLLSPWIPSCLRQEEALSYFDFLQTDHDPKENRIKCLHQYYGDVRIIENRALLLPLPIDHPAIKILPFFPEGNAKNEPGNNWEEIEIGSTQDWSYRLNLMEGNPAPALFFIADKRNHGQHNGLSAALTALSVPYSIQEDYQQERFEYDDAQFLPLFQKYWGKDAQFRSLVFYADPDRSHETENLGQGQIIAEIVDQCEQAYMEEPFSNIFITAPTGSGKSLLFQLPALYLSEKYNLVTLVVSPLIALMNDQVDQLVRERGISFAVCINSSMTMEERIQAMHQIQTGKKSLLYLAPELLLTTNLQYFLGGRKVGLVVIDEAHTVTSWGRDFRSDYWFLGDFLKKTARDGMRFPVLCLTATAVYSGEDDVVNDTIQELGLEHTIIHLGNVRRDNISFDIRLCNGGERGKALEEKKMDMLLAHIREYAEKKEKSLAYFPYRSQVDQIYMKRKSNEHSQIRRYHSKLSPLEKELTEKEYKNGIAKGLLCTKAFGMGIDVPDIYHVIHFAPTGTLADYVQEIGRAARNQAISGTAHIDYFPSDMRYVKALNGISEMRQYQLREMLKKLVSIYQVKKRRNLLISSETFEYLFKTKGEDVENRTKSGLMMLAKDLSNKYAFPVLIVRPKSMLSKNYISVPAEIKDFWLNKYGKFAEKQNPDLFRMTISSNGRNSDIKTYSSGDTYLVDMAGIWEKFYPDMSFGMFKKSFFEEKFKRSSDCFHVAPRARIDIHYTKDYDVVSRKVDTILQAIVDIFSSYKNAEAKTFSLQDFESRLKSELGEQIVSRDKLGLLLDIFTEDTDETAPYTKSRSQIRVLRKRKQPGKDESVYFVSSVAYSGLTHFFRQYLSQCAPNQKDSNTYYRFYPIRQDRAIEIMPLLCLLELLGFANYEVRGGEKLEIFVRINDPDKLQRILSEGKYSNGVLQAIQRKHKNNQILLDAFFRANLSDHARWELIEQYFLGHEDYVKYVLGIE